MLFGKRTPREDDDYTALRRRVDEVEDELAHLARRLERLRGQVTGGLRRAVVPDVPEAYDDDNGGDPEVAYDDHALGYTRRFKGG